MTSEAQKKDGWLLPEVITGYDLLCVNLRIPDNPEHREAFMGALHMLDSWYNWEKTYTPGDTRASQSAFYWRDLLMTYLSIGDCSDVGIDVRQNEETPCILEKTYNSGETWVQWANLALCQTPPRTVRYNPVTDSMEVSTDGGATWTPAPEIDPRIINTFPPASSKCDAAASMVRYIRDFIDMLVNIVNAGTALTAAITLIAGFLALIGAAFAALVLLMIDLFTFVTSTGASAVAAAFTSEVYDQLLCIFFCHVDDDGRLDDTSFSAVKSDINAQIGGIAAAALTTMFALMGFAGLNNAGASGLDTDDCSDCGCNDCSACDTPTTLDIPNNGWNSFPLGIIDHADLQGGDGQLYFNNGSGGGGTTPGDHAYIYLGHPVCVASFRVDANAATGSYTITIGAETSGALDYGSNTPFAPSTPQLTDTIMLTLLGGSAALSFRAGEIDYCEP